MKKKYFILAFTFLCLLMGQSSFGQIVNSDHDDDLGDPFDVCNIKGLFYDICECNHYDWCSLKEVVIIKDPCDPRYFDSCKCYPLSCDSMNPCDFSSSAYDFLTCYRLNHPLDSGEGGSDDGGSDDGGNYDPPPSGYQWYKDVDRDSFHSSIASTKEDISPGIDDLVDYWVQGISNGLDCDDAIYNSQNICTPVLTLTDADNPDRIATKGQTLVMVNKGTDRTANITADFNTPNSPGISNGNYPMWSGTGVTGFGETATYTGTTSTTVTMQPTENYISTAMIEIVDENRNSNSINFDMGKYFSLFDETSTSKSLKINGVISSQNVDKFAAPDIGKKYVFSLGLSGTIGAPEIGKIKTPIPGISVLITPVITATASSQFNFTYDESISNILSISNNFLKINGTLGIKVALVGGYTAGNTGNIELGCEIKLGGTANVNFSAQAEYGFKLDSKELYLTFTDSKIQGVPELFFELKCGVMSVKETATFDNFANGTIAKTGDEIILYQFN